MKKFILIISIFVINCNLVNAQGCLPNGITITSQEQIDNFQSSYPDCTIIEGNLIIGDAYNGTDVSNLIGLEHIVAIGGNLEIFGNDELINLNGLENLTSIGEDLKIGIIAQGMYDFAIADNPSLCNVFALNGLTSIGGGYQYIWE